MKNLTEAIKKDRLIAIIRGIAPKDLADVGHALLRGGIHFAEVTFSHGDGASAEQTLQSIQILKGEFGENLHVGAGTVLSAQEVEAAVYAGAEYIISPNTEQAVIQKTKALDAVSIPGAMTPTEIVAAYALGADFVKVFPAGNLGPAYIKAIRGPAPHIPLLAVGGIDADNLREFLQAGVCGFGIGGNLVNRALVREGRFQEIERIAKSLVAAAASSAV